MKRQLISILLAVSLAMNAACASKVPVALQAKATATYTVQNLGDAVDAAYKLELTVAPLIPAPTQKEILLGFAIAFDQIADAAAKLQTIKPGDAVPDSLNGAIDTLHELANFLATAPNASIQKVAAELNKALIIADAIVKVIKGGQPLPHAEMYRLVSDMRHVAANVRAQASIQ